MSVATCGLAAPACRFAHAGYACWGRGGSGKRGGARVIYFYRDADLPLYLLMIYAKARQEDLSANEKRAVRKLVGILKS